MKVKMIIFLDRWKRFWQRHRTHVAAAGMAVLIWFLVVANGTFDYEVNIPIDLSTLPPQVTYTNERPSQARIKVRGQGLALLALLIFKEARMELNIEPEIGRKKVHPSVDDILLLGSAKNVTVLQILDPLEVQLQIEPVVQRMIPVKNNARIKTAPGYTIVGDISLMPDRVAVRGGESLIIKIDSVETESIRLQGIVKPFTKQLNLLPPPQAGRFSMTPNKVTIEADVQKLMEKKIDNIPITVTNVPSGMQAIVIPPQLNLIAEGGVKIVANLTEKDIVAYIDYRRYKELNTTDSPAYIQPIPWVRYRDIEPKRFKVILEKK